MQLFSASNFEDYDSYAYKKKKKPKDKPVKRCKKPTQKEVQKYNSKVAEVSNQYAEDMKATPSELEKKMQQFLDNHNIKYDFQKVFNIKRKNDKIRKFYIADFYIPTKHIIIETDGAFHDGQIKQDDLRTKQIQKHYPNIKIIRWRWHDFESYTKMKNLLLAVS